MSSFFKVFHWVFQKTDPMLTQNPDCMQNKNAHNNQNDDLNKFRNHHDESADQTSQNDVLLKFRNYKI